MNIPARTASQFERIHRPHIGEIILIQGIHARGNKNFPEICQGKFLDFLGETIEFELVTGRKGSETAAARFGYSKSDSVPELNIEEPAIVRVVDSRQAVLYEHGLLVPLWDNALKQLRRSGSPAIKRYLNETDQLMGIYGLRKPRA
jgi:hypothetical protein